MVPSHTTKSLMLGALRHPRALTDDAFAPFTDPAWMFISGIEKPSKMSPVSLLGHRTRLHCLSPFDRSWAQTALQRFCTQLMYSIVIV